MYVDPACPLKVSWSVSRSLVVVCPGLDMSEVLQAMHEVAEVGGRGGVSVAGVGTSISVVLRCC